ncbi:MAG: THUMP domain-containing protein [Nitrososphaeraceae archaeon]|jgi:tRNA acetyltransferase TAN1|nr:THUMP domain-containing protein [Nitrososphaeraceae archaeon]MDW3629966.1 THUMP domain-containing protein [Nitrososphaeraceae archaeon]
MNFNLLVTTYRHREYDAVDELNVILQRFSIDVETIEIQNVSGIILALANLNPFELITKFKELLTEEPWQFRYILRVIPIERALYTDLKNIEREVENLTMKKIKVNDSFRISVEKRHTSTRSKEIISSIANKLQNKVSLENPDWIILIEIIGNKTGISILKERDIFNSIMEKRKTGYLLESSG